MQKFMEQFGEFWKVWGPWISISLIPTIIAGLSISPKTAPEAAFLKKAWDAIKQVLSFFSLATFKDDAGTFQAPKVLSVPYRMVFKKKDDKTPPPLPPVAVAVFLLVTLAGSAVSLPGCCAWRGTCGKDDTAGQIATGAIDCLDAALKEQITDLIPKVLSVLMGGSVDWSAKLNSLPGAGGKAFACAVLQATGKLLKVAAPPTGEGVSAPPEVLKERAAAADASRKGSSFIEEKKWKFTPASLGATP